MQDSCIAAVILKLENASNVLYIMLLDYHQLVRFAEVMYMAKHEFGIMNEVIPFFRADFAPTAFMLYGHVHQTIEYEYIAKLRREIKSNAAGHGTPNGNFINVG